MQSFFVCHNDFLYNIFIMNENKSIETHLDYLSSYKKVKKALYSVSKKEIVLSYDYDAFLSLWHGKSLILTTKISSYACPVYLFDKTNDVHVPLLIFATERRDENIYFKKILPMVNPVALELLEAEGIIPPEDFSWSNIPSYLSFIENALETNKKKDIYNLEYAFSYLSPVFALYISVYPFLSDRLRNEPVEEKYKGLFQELKEPKIEEEIEKDNLGCYVRLEHAKKRLNYYKSAKISYQGMDIVTDVLLRFLDSFIEKKETLLLLAPASEVGEVIKVLKDKNLSDFVLNYNDYNIEHIASVIENEEYYDLTDKDYMLIQSYEQKRERFLSFYDKKEECFSSLKKHLYPDYIEFMTKKDKISSYPLSVSSYTEEDYQKDKVFLSSFPSYDRITSTYLENHPLYGLTLTEEREEYDSLQLLLVQLMTSLKEFISLTEENSMFKDYDISIQNFDDYDRISHSFAVLGEYNGFPKKYFRLNQQGEKRLSLSQLKLRYQALSSSQLLVSNLMDDTIFNQDIVSLLDLYENGNFFERIKAKRKLSSYLRVKKQTDMKTVIRILHTYLISKEELNRVLPDYQEVYGDNVNTMNGVMEVESNIRYIDKFNSYASVNLKFTLDHPFIKRYLKDKDFRIDSQRQFKQISASYRELIDKLNQLVACFKDKQINLFSLDFSSLLNWIVLIQNQDYETYHQYASLMSCLKNTSKLLKDTIHQYIVNEVPLTDFADEFKMSLIISLYQHCNSRFSQYEKGYEMAKKEYEDSLSDTEEVTSLVRYQNLRDNILYFKSNLFTEKDELLNKINNLTYNRKERMEFLKSLFSLLPISVASIENIPVLDDDTYDHVIILDSGFFNNEELIEGYRLGKDVLLLNDHALFDSRTQFYHQTLINKEVLYQKVFDFSSLSKDVLDKIKEKIDYINTDIYPYVSKENNTEYALLPDCLLTHEKDIRFVMELAMFLSEENHLTIYLLDLLSILLK